MALRRRGNKLERWEIGLIKELRLKPAWSAKAHFVNGRVVTGLGKSVAYCTVAVN